MKNKTLRYFYPVADRSGEAWFDDVSGNCGGSRTLCGPYAVVDYGDNVLAVSRSWTAIQRRARRFRVAVWIGSAIAKAETVRP